MVQTRSAIVLLIGLLLAGCAGPGAKQMANEIPPSSFSTGNTSSSSAGNICPPGGKNLFFAAPVCTGYVLKSSDTTATTAADADADTANPTRKVAFISAALIDSRQKCQDFIQQFTAEQAGENTFLDVGALVVSGVAAAITGPASTIRALAAGSTALQGIKQTFNADFFQQLTIALFIQQINTTYFQVLDTQFPPTSLTSLTAAGSLAAIQSFHRNCSIPFAAANLNAGSQKPQPGAAATTFTINGTPASVDTLTLTASSASLNLSVSLTTTPNLSPATAYRMVRDLDEKAIATGTLPQAGVLVSVAQPSATSAKLIVQGGPSDIKWTLGASPNAKVTVAPPS